MYKAIQLIDLLKKNDEKAIRNYAECGVNYISSGALTHSVYNMDLSLKAI